jgi:hypothetical protein
VVIICAAALGARPGSAAARPCALLTPAQVGGAIGAAVGAGEAIGDTGCQWIGKANPAVRASLVLWPGSAFAWMSEPLAGVTKTHAGGIGEGAIYSTVGSLTSLSVKQGTTSFIIRLYGIAGRATQEAEEKTLALEVLKGL